jgi:hypothetical protein
VRWKNRAIIERSAVLLLIIIGMQKPPQEERHLSLGAPITIGHLDTVSLQSGCLSVQFTLYLSSLNWLVIYTVYSRLFFYIIIIIFKVREMNLIGEHKKSNGLKRPCEDHELSPQRSHKPPCEDYELAPQYSHILKRIKKIVKEDKDKMEEEEIEQQNFVWSDFRHTAWYPALCNIFESAHVDFITKLQEIVKCLTDGKDLVLCLNKAMILFDAAYPIEMDADCRYQELVGFVAAILHSFVDCNVERKKKQEEDRQMDSLNSAASKPPLVPSKAAAIVSDGSSTEFECDHELDIDCLEDFDIDDLATNVWC